MLIALKEFSVCLSLPKNITLIYTNLRGVKQNQRNTHATKTLCSALFVFTCKVRAFT